MSIALISATWELAIPSTEKMVLMCLADYANDDGENCWPAISTIARKCSKGERTIQGAIKWLAAEGYLIAQERPGRSTAYHLNPRKICTPAKSAPPQKTAQTPADSAPKPPRTTNTNTRGAGAMRLPPDWQPKPLPADVAEGVACWKAGAIEREMARFRDWAASAPGSKGVKSDWDATWRNWLRRKIDEGPSNDRKSSSHDEIRNPYARVAARQAAGAGQPNG